MKPRIAEVRKVAELLSVEHEDVLDLAREVIALAWEMAGERDKWCVVVNDPGVGVYVEGLFSSRNEVERAAKSGRVFSASAGATARIVRIVNV